MPPYIGAPPQPFVASSVPAHPYPVSPQAIPPLLPAVTTGECGVSDEWSQLFDITKCILNFISVLSTSHYIIPILDFF